MRLLSYVGLIACVLGLPGCGDDSARALGTLEWDRITVPAPAAERIVAVRVQEGQRVHGGDVLMELETTSTASQLAAAEAQVRVGTAALSELKAGPRREDIDRARAAVQAAQARALEASTSFDRLQALAARQLVPPADVDRARASMDATAADLAGARQALLELERGTRSEQVAQGQAAVQAYTAEADARRVLLDKLTLVAPRDGQVDAIPYKLGDQAPVGAPLVVLLAGAAPHARVYVPEPMRAGVQVGSPAQVHVEGMEQVWQGTVRMIRSEPTFTPYYALTGQDATRLSYLAEIQLAADAAELPAGLPVQAEFER